MRVSHAGEERCDNYNIIAVVYCVRYASCIVAKCLFSVLKVDSFTGNYLLPIVVQG